MNAKHQKQQITHRGQTMFYKGYLGAPCGLSRLRSQNEALSAKVLDQVSSNQELVTLNRFEQQCSEYQFRKCLEERIADLESWRWVLQDLSNRLDEVIQALQYEYKALRVVAERVQVEITRVSEGGTRPGALSPQSDSVEEAIYQEYKFLQEQRKRFEKMILELDQEIPVLQKIKKTIEDDAFNKQQAIHVDEKLTELELASIDLSKCGKRKNGLSPLEQWEGRCCALKKKGLCALRHALSLRQQVRGCRSLLSVAAQSYATRVDSLLKRRLYANTKKLEEIQWQKGEAQKDFKSLSDELTSTELSVMETMDKIKLMEARLADRRMRPSNELTKDDVDRKLKDELNRLKQFLKCLRRNIDRIESLQGDLTASITQMNCVEDDLTQVVQLDQDRVRSRAYDDVEAEHTAPVLQSHTTANETRDTRELDHLAPILEEDENVKEEDENVEKEDENVEEEDEYPFDF